MSSSLLDQALYPKPAPQPKPLRGFLPQLLSGSAPKPRAKAPAKPDIRALVTQAAKKWGVPPDVLLAIGEQESGLGTSAAYDPKTGLSRTPGNAGHGIFQLDPASGASQADLFRAAHDPAFAADRAAEMLSHRLHSTNGNMRDALAAYNAGGVNPAGLAYADSVLGRIPKQKGVPPLPKGFVAVSGAAAHRPPANTAPFASLIGIGEQVGGELASQALPAAVDMTRRAAQVAEYPLKGLDAVLGALQRGVAGTVGAAAQEPLPEKLLPPIINPDETLGAAYGIFHPNDPRVETRMEDALGLSGLKNPHPKSPLGSLQNFAVDTGAQIATDPLIAAAPLGEVERAATAGAEAAKLPLVRTGLDRVFAQMGHPIIREAEAATETDARTLAQSYLKHAAKHAVKHGAKAAVASLAAQPLPPGFVPVSADTPDTSAPAPSPAAGGLPGIFRKPDAALADLALKMAGFGGASNTLPTLMGDATEAAKVPLEGLNAIFGALQRANAGLLGETALEPYPEKLLPPMVDPAKIKAGLYGALHPNDQTVENRMEDAIGASALKVPHPQNFLDYARNFAVDTGAQTITDPLMAAAPVGLTERLGDEALSGIDDATVAALESPATRGSARWFATTPRARVALTKKTLAAYTGIHNSEGLSFLRRADANAAVLAKSADAIRATRKLTPELDQHLLEEAIVYGTPRLRAEALADAERRGIPVNPELLRKPPEGILDFHLKPDYFSHMKEHIAELTDPYARPQGTGISGGGFERPQMTEEIPDDPVKAMELRLAASNRTIQRRMVQKRLAQATGLPLRVTNANGKLIRAIRENPALQQAAIRPGKDLAARELLQNPFPATGEGLPGLRGLSDYTRDVFIAANALPHTKNIGELAYLAGGVPGLLRGAQYALSGVPEALGRRMEEMGAATHFMLTQPSSGSVVRRVLPAWYRRGNQTILDRWDMGMRAARLEQLDRRYGSTLTDFEKGARVNQDLGDYRNMPGYVQAARALGGVFPQWHLYIMPTTVARAALRNPQRVQALVRAMGLASQDIMQPAFKQGVNFGGPVPEFGTLTTPPVGTAKSLMSSSVVGPAIQAAEALTQTPTSFNPLSNPQALSSLIPLFNVGAPLFGYNPYHDPEPAWARALGAAWGVYPAARESAYTQKVYNLMKQGHSAYEAKKKIRDESYQLRKYIP